MKKGNKEHTNSCGSINKQYKQLQILVAIENYMYRKPWNDLFHYNF